MKQRSDGPGPTAGGPPDASRDRHIPAVVNTDAGTADAVIDALAHAGGFDLQRCVGSDVGATVQAAITGGHRRIVVAGGDGTIAAAAAELAGGPFELAIVPGGTLNHFARDHRIPVDLGEAIELARTGRAQPTDVGRVNGRVFLNTSSVGAYVSLVTARDRMERYLGYRLASLAAALREFVTMHRFAVEITGPEGTRTFRTPLLFVGVSERELKLPALGGRVPDGKAGLHVMVVKGRTRGAVLALAFAAATRGSSGTRTPHLETAILERFVVTLRQHTLTSTDGEIVRLESPLEYALQRGALQLVRPG